MDETLGWIASAATMVAAIMTAANLGSRVTGMGFVVFTIGSVAWSAVGILTGQTSLIITNVFLFAVNLFGVWRWLGRQARYEAGSAQASRISRQKRNVSSLFSAGSIIGAKVEDAAGTKLGTVIDVMLTCDSKQVAYVVIAEGDFVGARERLRVLPPQLFEVKKGEVACKLSFAEFCCRPEIDPECWPDTTPETNAN